MCIRDSSASSVRDQPHGMDVVVRALPPAAAADWDELGSDYRAAFTAAVRRAR